MTSIKKFLTFIKADTFESLLNEKAHLVGFENGVIDLQNGEFRKHYPEDMISFSTKINYIPYSEVSPVILGEIMTFLEQVLPNPEIRNYVLTYLASCLYGGSLEEFVFWTGSGGNGKSKLLELFQQCFGDYIGFLPISLFTNGLSNSASPDASQELVKMKSIRVGVLQEPEENAVLNTGLLKELTGNDTITCRALHEAPIEFKPMFKLICLTNKLPRLENANDGGIGRRLRVVDFKSEFVDHPIEANQFKKDPNLSNKFPHWKETFMSLLIHVYMTEYKKHGLIIPEQVKMSTEIYKRSNNILKDFIEEKIIKKDGATLLLPPLWSSVYKEWGLQNNSKLSRAEFISQVKRILCVTDDGTGAIKGYSLKTEDIELESIV